MTISSYLQEFEHENWWKNAENIETNKKNLITQIISNITILSQSNWLANISYEMIFFNWLKKVRSRDSNLESLIEIARAY